MDRITIVILWFILGFFGCVIFNRLLEYDSISTKYTWNILVFLNGIFGFLFSVILWTNKQVDEYKKNKNGKD